MTGRGSIYIDVMGFVPLHACRHPEHPQTRTEDLKSRRRLFALARKEFGSVATEAAPADYCADVVDLGAFSFSPRKSTPVLSIRFRSRCGSSFTMIPFWDIPGRGSADIPAGTTLP